jgi:tetratricopeptide (TPR) repeat protein
MTKRLWIHLVLIILVGFGVCLGLQKLGTIIVHDRGNLSLSGRFGEVLLGESSSGSDRLYYLKSAFEMWFDRPLLGAGAGTYGDVHPQYQHRVVSASSDAHNVYAQTLAELGLIGAALLAAVLLWLGLGVLRGVLRQPQTLAIVLGLLGLLMHAGLDIDASYPALLALAAVLAGLVYEPWFEARQAASWRWPLAAALLLVPLVSLYQASVWQKRAEAAQEDNDYATAVEDYARAEQMVIYDPDLVNAEGIGHYVLAVGGGVRGMSELGLDRARQAQRLDSHDSQHYQLEGRILAWRGDLAPAETAFRTALRLDPYNHPDYAMDLAAVLVRRGRPAEAVAVAKAMLAQYPQEVVDNRNYDHTIPANLDRLRALVRRNETTPSR